MSLYDELLSALPELKDIDFNRIDGTIELANDGDGMGDFIKTWNYKLPLPNGFKIGK